MEIYKEALPQQHTGSHQEVYHSERQTPLSTRYSGDKKNGPHKTWRQFISPMRQQWDFKNSHLLFGMEDDFFSHGCVGSVQQCHSVTLYIFYNFCRWERDSQYVMLSSLLQHICMDIAGLPFIQAWEWGAACHRFGSFSFEKKCQKHTD